MNKNVTRTLSALALASASFVFLSCSDNSDATPVDTALNTEILANFSTNVAQANYNDLKAKASTLNDDIQSFIASKDEFKLAQLQTDWKLARMAWERSEAFLFGPVAIGSIDPSIDTWPINQEDLNATINSDKEFTEDYLENELTDDVKGFHPIEYIIFGKNGNKTVADFTNDRELDYLAALGVHLKTRTTLAATSWDPSTASNYTTAFSKAGAGSTVYATQRAAFVEMVEAMAGICEEVGEEKIGAVYEAQDPSLEESPYSQNSLLDFTDNIVGVLNVYQGKYSADGTSLEDLVKKYNLTLDNEIKSAITTAITSLQRIDGPFGEAISHGANVQVQNAIDAIKALHDKLDDGADSNNDLHYLVEQHTN